MNTRISLLAATTLLALFAADPVRAEWVGNGDSLCVATNEQSGCVVASDNLGGAIVAWRDRRTGGNGLDVYAQAISAVGTTRWVMNGVAISTATGDQTNLSITTDGKGGAILAWEDYRKSLSSAAIYAQRVRSSGAVVWTASGIPIDTLTGYQVKPIVVPDGTGGALIAWEASRSGRSQIYAQRVDSLGVIQWAANGIAVAPTSTEQNEVAMVSDGAHGALLAWSDARETAGSYYSVCAQRITSSGSASPSWPADGVKICSAAVQGPGSPTLAADDSGGAVVAWPDDRDYSPNGTDIYAQRIGGTGLLRWTINGVVVCAAGGDQASPQIVTDGSRGAIIGWEDLRNGALSTTVYAQRLLAGGTRAWTPADGVLLCNATGRRSALSVIADGAGGALATWQDYRSGVQTDIWAQRVNAAGTLQWNAAAVQICGAANDQQLPRLVSDLAGGAIIAWHDNRKGSMTSNYDIFAQRVTASGSVAPVLDVSLVRGPAFRLEPPRPNPARGAVAITLVLPVAAAVEAEIFDVTGRRVTALAAGEAFPAGSRTMTWDGRGAAGEPAPAGLYFLRVRAGAFSAERKLVRTR